MAIKFSASRKNPASFVRIRRGKILLPRRQLIAKSEVNIIFQPLASEFRVFANSDLRQPPESKKIRVINGFSRFKQTRVSPCYRPM
jgi:hypothetical protein